jgi:hypothetical protein
MARHPNKEIDMTKAFSDWESWTNRVALADLAHPGVYALAISSAAISGTAFSWRPEVVYIGMTNSKGGLKSQIQQFDNTIKGGYGHGGAFRVLFKHADYATLKSKLYVSVCSWDCDVTLNDSANLRIMGEVAKHECVCFSLFVEKFGQLPQFNDKKRSPKK